MHCSNVLDKVRLVVSPVWAVRAKIGSFACMSQDVLFQISLPRTTREHLAALAAHHNVLLTTTLFLLCPNINPDSKCEDSLMWEGK